MEKGIETTNVHLHKLWQDTLQDISKELKGIKIKNQLLRPVSSQDRRAKIGPLQQVIATLLFLAFKKVEDIKCSFPSDLQEYTERKPCISPFLMVIQQALALFPNAVEQLTQPHHWSIFCCLLEYLEDKFDTHKWAKNDDKLLVLEIILDLIDEYHVKPRNIFNMDLINGLTTQYLVSTRSDVVSQHMEKVVSITFQLLTHFARDVGNKDNWITQKIVDKHWFLWIITDIVIPHNIYGSNVAANAALTFIETIIDYKCMKKATKHIGTIMTKLKTSRKERCWKYEALSKKPQQNLFKLLILFVKRTKDHITFSNSALFFMENWVKHYFLMDCFDEKEHISTLSTALDFFQGYIVKAIKCLELQNTSFLFIKQQYIMAISTIFAYYSSEALNSKWSVLVTQSLHLLSLLSKYKQCSARSSHGMERIAFCLFIGEASRHTKDRKRCLKYYRKSVQLASKYNAILHNIGRSRLCSKYMIFGEYNKALIESRGIDDNFDIVYIKRVYIDLLMLYYMMGDYYKSKLQKILHLMKKHEYIQHEQCEAYWIGNIRLCLWKKNYAEAMIIYAKMFKMKLKQKYKTQWKIICEYELFPSIERNHVEMDWNLIDLYGSEANTCINISMLYCISLYIDKCSKLMSVDDKIKILSKMRYDHWFALGIFIAGKLSFECGKYILARKLILRACKCTPELPMIRKYGDKWRSLVIEKVNHLECSYCGIHGVVLKACGGCCATQYCSKICQKKAWELWHRNTCDGNMISFLQKRKRRSFSNII